MELVLSQHLTSDNQKIKPIYLSVCNGIESPQEFDNHLDDILKCLSSGSNPKQNLLSEINQYLGHKNVGLEFFQIDPPKLKSTPEEQVTEMCELCSVTKLFLLAYLWAFISKNEEYSQKIKNNKWIFLLDEPDSHIHQNRISSLMKIIKKRLVKQLNFQVILTTRNDRTVSYLEERNSNSGDVGCFMMMRESLENDNKVKMKKWSHFALKDLMDNYYLSIRLQDLNEIEDKNVFEDMIITCYEAQVINNLGTSMESLIRYYFEKHKKYSLEFLKLEDGSNFSDSGYNFKMVENIEKEQFFLDFEKETSIENQVVWPTKSNNACFDFVTLSRQRDKILICFYQVTVEIEINSKLSETFKEEKINNFYGYIENLKRNNTVKFCLIHGNQDKDRSLEKINDKFDIKCYSFRYLGEKYFKSTLMQELDIIKFKHDFKMKLRVIADSNESQICEISLNPEQKKEQKVAEELASKLGFVTKSVIYTNDYCKIYLYKSELIVKEI